MLLCSYTLYLLSMCMCLTAQAQQSYSSSFEQAVWHLKHENPYLFVTNSMPSQDYQSASQEATDNALALVDKCAIGYTLYRIAHLYRNTYCHPGTPACPSGTAWLAHTVLPKSVTTTHKHCMFIFSLLLIAGQVLIYKTVARALVYATHSDLLSIICKKKCRET